jgi:hypothetical protein
MLMGLNKNRSFHAAFGALVLVLTCAGFAQATPQCPSRKSALERAETIVEVRVKSFFIGESGLISTDEVPTRMMRAELEVVRVLKGKFDRKEIVALGSLYPPGHYAELTWMALRYGIGGDTFEWAPSLTELQDGLQVYTIGGCEYYKFPDDVEEMLGTENSWRRNDMGELIPLPSSPPEPSVPRSIRP